MITKIEYLDETWNPTTGCEPILEGCRFCWAKAVTERFGESWGYDFTPQFHPDRLEIPLRWKRPRRIGVSFMGDLFHREISPMCRRIILNTIEKCPEHTFIILTKRPEQMVEDFLDNTLFCDVDENLNFIPRLPDNLWLGVSVENQEEADKRIPILLDIPAAIRFVSVEPMLSYVDLWRYLPVLVIPNNDLDWVIIGAESGPKARKIDNSHILNLLLQCSDASTPVFLKQAWINNKLVKMPNLGGQVWDQMPK